MSIQHMRQRFAIQLRYVLWAIIIAFVIGLPLVFVPGSFTGRQRDQEQPQAAEQITAMVNGQPVTGTDVTYSFNRMVNERLPFLLQAGQSIGIGQLWMLRYEALEGAIQRRLLLDAARQQGISVSKGEMKKQAQQLVDQEIAQLKGQYQGPQLEQVFARIAAQQGDTGRRETISERQFVKWAMGRYLGKTTGLHDDLVMQKLQQAVTERVSTSEQDLLQSYDTATVRSIVVASNPEGKGARTDAEARKRAEELIARIEGGADFAAVAKAESDDPAAKQTGGLMDGVRRGAMGPDWDKAVFALKPGEVSGPIKLAWGYAVVKMDTIGRQFPPDFDKNKQQLLKSVADQRRGEAWQRYVNELRQQAKVEVRDPEMQAYQALMQGKAEEAFGKLNLATAGARNSGGLEAASVFYEFGRLLAGKQKWEEASNAFAEAADALSAGVATLVPEGRAEALVAMANAYEQQGDSKEAIAWYQAASEAAGGPATHQQLQSAFQRLGQPELAKQEQEWMASYQQEQRERQAQLEAQRKAAEAQAKERTSAPAPAPQGPQPAREPR